MFYLDVFYKRLVYNYIHVFKESLQPRFMCLKLDYSGICAWDDFVMALCFGSHLSYNMKYGTATQSKKQDFT